MNITYVRGITWKRNETNEIGNGYTWGKLVKGSSNWSDIRQSDGDEGDGYDKEK